MSASYRPVPKRKKQGDKLGRKNKKRLLAKAAKQDAFLGAQMGAVKPR